MIYFFMFDVIFFFNNLIINYLYTLYHEKAMLKQLMKYTFFLKLLFLSAILRGQNTMRLTLPQVVDMARNQSISARQAATTKETKYWEYRTFQSNYKPQLTLTSNFPAFNRTFQQVIQPDGTVVFQPIRNNNSSVGVSLSQNIARTGGSIYAQTQVQRFDDFDRKKTLYNGTLFAIGISRPLFRFNNFKWEKQIEPLKYNEFDGKFGLFQSRLCDWRFSKKSTKPTVGIDRT